MTTVRDAAPEDGAACEHEPPTGEEMTRRLAVTSDKHAWVVLEEDDQVVGHAYAACEVGWMPGARRDVA